MQPEISFYVLASHTGQQRLLYACKLIEKAYRTQHYPFVLLDDPQQAEQLDQLLWTFRAGSFVPHERYANQAPELPQTVLIGSEPVPSEWRTVLLNLNPHCATELQGCQRLLEIVNADPQLKHEGRERYRQYKQAGYSIKTIQCDED